KKSGRALSEFQQMDRNGDGFLTVEEVLSWQAIQNKGKGGNGQVAGGPSPGMGGPRGGGNFGGPPGGGNFGPPGGGRGGKFGPPNGGAGADRGGNRGGPRGFGPNNGQDTRPADNGGKQGGRRNRQNGGG